MGDVRTSRAKQAHALAQVYANTHPHAREHTLSHTDIDTHTMYIDSPQKPTCRLQWVKYAASSAARLGSSLISRRFSSMRRAIL